MDESPKAQNEAGVGIRILAGMLALVSVAILVDQLTALVATASLASLDWELMLSGVFLGALSAPVAIRGFLPPSLFTLLPGFGRATAGKKLRDR